MRKKTIFAMLAVSTLIMGVSIWWGGQNTWKLLGFRADSASHKEDLEILETILKEMPEEGLSKYNLSVVQYRQGHYQKAVELLEELLNSGNPGAGYQRSIHYNLGNSYYRQSESSDSIAESIKLLEQSLLHYRAIIDQDRQKLKYTDIAFKADKDAQFNYVLVRTKLKLLNDKLRQQQNNQAKEKQLYQLLKELREREKTIADQLRIMKNDPLSSQSLAKREELLNIRKENLSQLQIIKNKLLDTLSQNKP